MTNLKTSNALDGFYVDVDEDSERADIVFNRPPLNIVSMTQREQLRYTLEDLDNDPKIRIIVIRAEGKHFSSGGDIQGFMEQTPEHVSNLAWNIGAVERCSKPVIAAIHGYCFGVAFELSLACDFRIVTESAQLALPEQRIGMIPGSGGSARLLNMIGIARTKDLCMRGRRIAGKQAFDWGIATQCVADDKLDETTDELANELRQYSPLAQRTIKGLLNTSQNTSVHAGIELEGQAYGRLRSSDDFKEGVASFREKRKPKFTGK